MALGKSGDTKLEVLVSYCDEDSSFAEQVIAGLKIEGPFSVSSASDADTRDDWKSRLGGLVAKAHSIVFVMSPASIRSEACTWLIAHARELETRIVPVTPGAMLGVATPDALTSQSIIRFNAARSFQEGFSSLVTALRTDSGWLRQHAELFAKARAWEAAGRPDKLLLSGDDIGDAKAWTFDRPIKAPKPTDLHLAYISASESVQTTVESKTKKHEKASSAAASSPQGTAPAAKKPYWRSASRFYDALIGGALVVLAAYAGWQAFQANKQAESATRMIAEANEQAAKVTTVAEEQLQLAEKAVASHGANIKRVETAMRSVSSSICKEAENLTNILTTTNDPAVWDISFNLFWTLHEMSAIELQKFEGIVTDLGPPYVKPVLDEFGEQLGKRGEAAGAREAGLPLLTLLEHAQNVARNCGKFPGNQN